ncbi:type IV pilin protein [Marinobacter sp. AN1]|uniref:type IV pilin protein n=1 Tax=Marinobacter sp. AN1 TaxID=2886046 RepID=UPI00222F6026|nr:type IV pilin protein [Marinobacter sp. AN1]UZD66781.1 type IV pilin protein [Marinobacter sp. AN1]
MASIANRERGFTLIELMIVVAVIGILAAIAYPSYQNSVDKSRRTDGKSALSGLAGAMERHYTTNSTYEGAATGGADTGSPEIFPDEAPLDSSNKFYDLTIEAADATSFTLRAAPKGVHAGDGYLELTSTGVRRWDQNNNGAIDAGENTWEE